MRNAKPRKRQNLRFQKFASRNDCLFWTRRPTQHNSKMVPLTYSEISIFPTSHVGVKPATEEKWTRAPLHSNVTGRPHASVCASL